MKTLFGVAAGVTLLLGIGWTFLPETMLSSWAVQSDAIGVSCRARS